MNSCGNKLGPVFTAHLFHAIEGKLIELLQSLSDTEWELQTISPKSKVKDVAAHLLDTQLRKLSMACCRFERHCWRGLNQDGDQELGSKVLSMTSIVG